VTGFDVTEVEWKMEFDVCETLRTMGHAVVPLAVKDDLSPVRKAIADHAPHVIFNLLESFHDRGAFDQPRGELPGAAARPLHGVQPAPG